MTLGLVMNGQLALWVYSCGGQLTLGDAGHVPPSCFGRPLCPHVGGLSSCSGVNASSYDLPCLSCRMCFMVVCSALRLASSWPYETPASISFNTVSMSLKLPALRYLSCCCCWPYDFAEESDGGCRAHTPFRGQTAHPLQEVPKLPATAPQPRGAGGGVATIFCWPFYLETDYPPQRW